MSRLKQEDPRALALKLTPYLCLEARCRQGLTLKDLAGKAGVDPVTISAYERNIRNAKPMTRYRIARILAPTLVRIMQGQP